MLICTRERRNPLIPSEALALDVGLQHGLHNMTAPVLNHLGDMIAARRVRAFVYEV